MCLCVCVCVCVRVCVCELLFLPYSGIGTLSVYMISLLLNYTYYVREFQNRGTEHVHAPIHVQNAPKIDEESDVNDSDVVTFVDKYMCFA